jgi:hypothetical protein
MTIAALENLVKIGKLKVEPSSRAEFAGFIKSGQNRLADARNKDLSSDSRFDLAYSASHAFALAALRHKGYRSEDRYIVFQPLPHTLGFDAATTQVFARAHNLAEYEGRTEIDEKLLADLIRCAGQLEKAVAALEPPAEAKT